MTEIKRSYDLLYKDKITCWDAVIILQLENNEWKKKLNEDVDVMGNQSALAQGLQTSITSIEKLLQTNHTLLIICDVILQAPLGYIKYGYKDLYFYQKTGQVILRANVPAFLDFYVSEEHQRKGLGKDLFQAMLQKMQVSPNQLAYDRPSPKLYAFLQKHYQLTNPDLQPNRYSIYEPFLTMP